MEPFDGALWKNSSRELLLLLSIDSHLHRGCRNRSSRRTRLGGRGSKSARWDRLAYRVHRLNALSWKRTSSLELPRRWKFFWKLSCELDLHLNIQLALRDLEILCKQPTFCRIFTGCSNIHFVTLLLLIRFLYNLLLVFYMYVLSMKETVKSTSRPTLCSWRDLIFCWCSSGWLLFDLTLKPCQIRVQSSYVFINLRNKRLSYEMTELSTTITSS